ncbi:unnamed protein product [Peniophora sp. CBMAI 1063]|nr:unnamed protein product [Peniophora sp. CBMAI 1063]
MSTVLSWQLDPPRGFHPVSRIKLHIDASDPACSSSCSLRLHHALPSALFADPYELQLHADAYTAQVPASKRGVDLEAPAFAVDPERAGRKVLVDVKGACGTDGELEVDIPLHVRYLEPRKDGDEDGPVATVVEPPVAFWACSGKEGEPTLDDELTTLLPDHTLRRLPRKGDVQSQTLPVPVGDIRHLSGVEAGTVVTIVLAACYVAWKIIAAASRIAGAQAAERRVKRD